MGEEGEEEREEGMGGGCEMMEVEWERRERRRGRRAWEVGVRGGRGRRAWEVGVREVGVR